MAFRPLIWKRNDVEGHETARVDLHHDGRQLEGTAVFAFEGVACRLDYDIRCTREWMTKSAMVTGWIGDREIAIDIVRSPAGDWTVDGALQPAVASCDDVDLNFSPSTNLLPIRRLDLEIGASATVRAAWLRFPQLMLQPLVQTYTRTALNAFRYKAGTFEADIAVDDEGQVLDYSVWSRVEL